MSEYDEYMEGNTSGDEAPPRPALTSISAWGTSYRKGEQW